jgi:uncharacterized protein YlxP (DUF503 family)
LIVGTVEIDLHLPGVNSLKEKRRRIKSLLARIQNRFNISISEVEYQDKHRMARLGVAVVSNDSKFTNQVIAQVMRIIEGFPEVELIDYRMEIL